MEIRGDKVKDEQAFMRDMIAEAELAGVHPVERAMAMFMEADHFLKSQGFAAYEIDKLSH